MKKKIKNPFMLSLVALSTLLVATPTAIQKTAMAAMYTYAAVNEDEHNISVAPTIVAKIDDASKLQYANGLNKAQNALVKLDSNLNVLDAKGKVISNLEAFIESTNRMVIPNFYVSDVETIDAITAYQSQNQSLEDVTIVSNDLSVIAKSRKNLPAMRCAYDMTVLSDAEFNDKKNVLASANTNGALILIMNSNQANKEIVEYYQYRAKTVWVELTSTDVFTTEKALASGAFGIITNGDPKKVDDVYSQFDNLDLPVSTRASMNIGHRGAPRKYNENSMESFIAAYEGGATHVEVDGYLTKDNQIVIMHNDTLNATTNYTGTSTIAQMTMSEIQEYKITKNINGISTGVESKIPTIDDLFSYFSDKDDCVIVFEIKDSRAEMIPYFKAKVEEYHMEDKLFIISFHIGRLQDLRDRTNGTPYIWSMCLDKPKPSDTKTVSYVTSEEIGLDITYTALNNSLISTMVHRGYFPGAWTYAFAADVKQALKNGVFAITSNDAISAGGFTKDIVLPENPEKISKAQLKDKKFKIPAKAVSYDGTSSDVSCSVVSYKDRGDHADAILIGLSADGSRFILSDVVELPYVKTSGCGGIVSMCVSMPVTLSLLLSLFTKKKKTE